VPLPLGRMCYDEAMGDSATMRPICDLAWNSSTSPIGQTVRVQGVSRGCRFRGWVRGINAKGAADRYSRKGIDELTAYVVETFGAKGLAWFKVEADGKFGLASPRTSAPICWPRFPSDGRRPGDLLLIVADKFEITCKALYALRKRLEPS